MSRETGEPRWWVGDHADTRTGTGLMAENVPAASTILYTDAWPRYRGSHPAHATVCHSAHEWARDDDGDGQREVHCNTCEGAGAALRTDLRGFRGVHQRYLHRYVATYEAMVHAKRVTPELIRRMCIVDLSMHTGYTWANKFIRQADIIVVPFQPHVADLETVVGWFLSINEELQDRVVFVPNRLTKTK
jgi:hypothetical protein